MKIGILISGRGSNMVALAESVAAGRIPEAEIAVVISDQGRAAGLARAAELGLETLVIERGGRARELHDEEIIAALKARGVELVCLAGYMRLLSPRFVEAFRGRTLNIHPSLLPAFPGLDAHQQALQHGVKWTGCTVHFVDESLDGGPIIAQQVVPVHDDDTVETLAERILREEHRIYTEAVARVVRGAYEIDGRRVKSKRQK
ncbi:MAG TPA: phosphoribosylglycinamide formyltransferase [Pyrinomonadaceae bacterium]|jgi:phosphoribosylglycinamide formyltransferase-1|nr:phosphoribosylglycinamide formyltransferase [Pyrinomonadaceae bacterium]